MYKKKTNADEFFTSYKTNVTKVPGHNCVLPQAEDVIASYIDTGCAVFFRRKFRQWLMVNSNYPESKAKLKSSASIRAEEERHLQYFYYTIHPFSSGRALWETIMILVYIISFVFVAVQVSMPVDTLWIIILEAILLVPLFIDIVLWFFTGYFDETMQKVILNQKKIIRYITVEKVNFLSQVLRLRRYLLSFFIFDFLSSIPINIIFYCCPEWKFIDEHYELWRLNILTMFKVPRMYTLDKYIRKLGARHKITGFYLNAATFGLTIILSINWAAAILFAVLAPEMSEFASYLLFLLRIISKFMLVGLATAVVHDKLLLALQMLFLVAGCILTKYIMIKIMAIYTSRASAEHEYENLVHQMTEYMKYKLLPKQVKERVFQFIDFKYQKHVYNEDIILNTLSSTLKKEILLHNCQRLIEKVDFFKGIPLSVISRISSKLRLEIFLPNDLIIQAGTPGNSMYFIHLGTVAVYTVTGKEIIHLSNGSHFGEISLAVKELRVATVTAIQECELFRLSRKDFQHAIQPFPELAQKIKEEAIARLEKTLRIMGEPEDKIRLKKLAWMQQDSNEAESDSPKE